MNHNELHRQALEIVRRYKRAEADLIDILQKIDHQKSFREFGCTSLYGYAIKMLELSENEAYCFINVARKAAEVPALKAAIARSEISVSKAKKITSVLNVENHEQWLAMAKALPQKMLEKEVAKVNPKAATQDRAIYVTDKRMELTMGLSEALMLRLKRVQDLECQRTQKAVDYEATLEALVEFYLAHKDPMQKSQPKLVARLVGESKESKPPKSLTAARKAYVLRSHSAQCTAINKDGSRCRERRWLHIHHLIGRVHGGNHAINNLTVLCATHHRLLHRD